MVDIDKFLDKELQIEKVEDGKALNRGNLNLEEPVKIEPANAATAKSEDGINSEIGLLEKQYFDLWGKITKENLLWNNELYGSLISAADEIREKAGKFLLKINSDKKTAKELIEMAKKELEKSNHEEALVSYSRIVAIRDSIPNSFFEEKAEINDQLFYLYQALHKQIDLKFSESLMITIEKIDSLVGKSFKCVKVGNLTEVAKLYSGAVELFTGLPHGFLLQKVEIGFKIIALYKELSIHSQIRSLQQQLLKDKAKNPQEAEFRGYKLKRLSEITRLKKDSQETVFSREQELTAPIREKTSKYGKDILRKLVERKIERAKISVEKGFYADAKKNIEAALRLEPNNMNAKRMLIKIPK